MKNWYVVKYSKKLTRRRCALKVLHTAILFCVLSFCQMLVVENLSWTLARALFPSAILTYNDDSEIPVHHVLPYQFCMVSYVKLSNTFDFFNTKEWRAM